MTLTTISTAATGARHSSSDDESVSFTGGRAGKLLKSVHSRQSRRRGRDRQNSKDNDLRTDLHILKGDVPTCQPGRILGHEGVGIIDKVGPAVTAFKPLERAAFGRAMSTSTTWWSSTSWPLNAPRPARCCTP
jgi:hypothetical protein